MPKKSWTEKYEGSKPHEVKILHRDIAGMKAGQIMLLPSPRLVDEYIRTIPNGESMDVKTMREGLAKEHDAEVTCPIVTGFQLRTVAEFAWEEYEKGKAIDEIPPVWRVIDENTPTFTKLSFDGEFLLDQRKREGI